MLSSCWRLLLQHWKRHPLVGSTCQHTEGLVIISSN